MRGALKTVAVILAVVLGAGLISALFWWNHKDRQNQLADFRADVVASGFTLAPGGGNPRLEDETSGNTTETTIEAIVAVRGCAVELERKLGEDNIAGKRQGRDIEVYELDEVARGHGEVDVNDAKLTPTPAEAEQYLLGHRPKFAYCLVG